MERDMSGLSFDFTNKHVIVTGGANGIGRCIVEKFLKTGAYVDIIDIDAEASERMRSSYKKLRFQVGDIAEKNILDVFTDSLTYPADCVINNACISKRGLLSGCSYDDFEYVQRVGVIAPYYLTSLLYHKNLLAQGASIVNIASTRAFQSQQDTESYSAAKGGIVALTHSLSVSLAGKARVNAISPGWIETAGYHEGAGIPEWSVEDNKQHPAGCVGTPEDIAGMTLFLCSDAAGFITGENIFVDGGMSKLMVYHNDQGWEWRS